MQGGEGWREPSVVPPKLSGKSARQALEEGRQLHFPRPQGGMVGAHEGLGRGPVWGNYARGKTPQVLYRRLARGTV